MSGDQSCEDKRIKNIPVRAHKFFSKKKLVPKLLVPRMTALYTTSSGMIVPSFESHQCLAGTWKRRLGCQEVGRCSTRGESQGTCKVTHTPPLSLNKAEPTLALKPRGDITRSLKQGYQWPHKKDLCPPKNYF